MSHGWSGEREALLRKLWAEGLSAAQIAKQLGGVSRNAVIGKVHRLGLAGRATPSRRVRPRQHPHRGCLTLQRARAHEVALVVSANEHAAAVARSRELAPVLMENGRPCDVHALNESTCRFPIGDPADSDFGFCGRGVLGSGCYCADHAKLCYPPVQKRVRRVFSPARRRDDKLAQFERAAGY